MSSQNRKDRSKAWQERDPRKVIEGLQEAEKVVLGVAQPFRTHVIPLTPILQELQGRGHDVAVVSPEKDSQRVAAQHYRLPYISAGDPWSSAPEAGTRLGRLRVEQGNEEFNRVMYGEYFAPAARAMFPQLEEIVERIGRDKVQLVTDCSDFATKMVGEALGVDVTTFDNGLVRDIMENWEHIRPVLNEVRAEFGLPPEPEERPAGYDKLWTPAPPELILEGLDLPGLQGYQREIAKRVGEGLPDGVFTSGRPNVYAMLGSSANTVEEFGPLFEHANIETIKALTEGGYDALISVASAENVEKYQRYAGPNVKVVAYADQPEALRQADVYIGHGGFGGLGEMIKGETPAVILPHFADQPYNGARIQATGMGLSFADSREATAGSIRAKIDEIIAHPEQYLAAVQDMHDRMAELPTLGNVIDGIAGPAEMPGGTLPAHAQTREVITVGRAVEGVLLDAEGSVVEGVEVIGDVFEAIDDGDDLVETMRSLQDIGEEAERLAAPGEGGEVVQDLTDERPEGEPSDLLDEIGGDLIREGLDPEDVAAAAGILGSLIEGTESVEDLTEAFEFIKDLRKGLDVAQVPVEEVGTVAIPGGTVWDLAEVEPIDDTATVLAGDIIDRDGTVVEAPADEVEGPAAEVEAPADEVEGPAAEVEAPADEVEVVAPPAQEIEPPAENELRFYDPYARDDEPDWF